MKLGIPIAAIAASLIAAWPAAAQLNDVAPLTEAAPAEAAPSPSVPKLSPGQPIPPGELEAYIDGVVHAAMLEHHIAGVVVSAIQGGRLVLNKGYGFADVAAGKRVDPNTTLFRIGSITKTFTWIVVMKAVEEGKIGLDDPINDHLPTELQIPADGFKEPVLVRHFMTHSPGFEDRTLGSLFVDRPDDVRGLERYLREERVARVREPGTLNSYSNYGVALVGAAIEHAEGAQWQDIIEREILMPLGMAHTSAREPYPAREGLPAPMPEALAGDLSLPYRWTGVSHQPRAFEYITQIAPAGVVSSTGADMARYMLMLLGDGTLGDVRIFGPDTAKVFRTPMTAFPPESGNWAGGFAAIRLRGGYMAYMHDGGTLSFFSEMMIVPELGLGIFVSTNTEGAALLSGRLAPMVVASFYAPLPNAPLAGSPDLMKKAANYQGSYISTRRAYGGLEGAIGRLNQVPVAVSPDGYLTISAQGQVQRFVPTEDPAVFRPAEGEGLLVFDMEEGRATRIRTLGLALERASWLESLQTMNLVAMLALLSAVLAVAGVVVRLGRGLPQTQLQGLAGTLQVVAALAFLGCAVAAGIFAATASDATKVVYVFPTAPVYALSIAALLSSLLTLGTLIALPFVWRGESGTEGWSAWRKLRFTMTCAIFALLSVMLGLWGLLVPWEA